MSELTPEARDRALALIFTARDRLVWDYNGQHEDIAVWDAIEAIVMSALERIPSPDEQRGRSGDAHE